MSERLRSAFARVRAQGRAALVTYVCAGDPSLAATARLVPELERAGADVVELGIPFSDPIADGPVIQAAAHRAIAAGASCARILELAASLRASGVEIPLVLMGYLNPIVAMGLERFAELAAAAQIDGLIVPDLPLEEAEPISALLASKGIDLVLLATPTTKPERLAEIGRRTRGFLYFVSVTGVTGERAAFPPELGAQLAAARGACSWPVAVGFGVSTPELARQAAGMADAVVVGSALVREIDRTGADPDALVAFMGRWTSGLLADG